MSNVGKKFYHKGKEYTITHDGTQTGEYVSSLLAEIEHLKGLRTHDATVIKHYIDDNERLEAERDKLLAVLGSVRNQIYLHIGPCGMLEVIDAAIAKAEERGGK